MDIVSKYTALLGQQKLKESFVKDLELVLSRKDPNIEKGKLNFIRYSEMKNWSVRELFGEDLEQADRALINKVYHMLFDIGSDFESVIIYKDGHVEPFTGDNSKDCVRYIGLKHRYMSFAISLTEHDIVQLLDDDSREESGSGTYYERECDALFDIDGRGNTERLVARNPKLRNLLEDGEYIPSLGQLNLMAHYIDELNKAFTYVSASPLSSTWYWSSTESSQAVAWYVVFSSGLTGTGNKHIGDMVRTVIDF